MNKEVLLVAEQLKEAYEGAPWFGRNIKTLLEEAGRGDVFQKPNDQHSILELLWHMILWREFTISRIRFDDSKRMQYWEENDWRKLDHSDKTLWQKGLQLFAQVHNELVEVLQQQNDDLLIKPVPGRKYNFRKLLHGIVQHDIYHTGQIAYVMKMLK
jgi:uncharacterized damage-inducible protein DinB